MKIRNYLNLLSLLSAVIIFSYLSCENVENQYPTGLDSLSKNTNVDDQPVVKVTSDIIINSTADVLDFSVPMEVEQLPGPDGLVTLNEALVAANNTPGSQVIGFNIPSSDPGFNGKVFVIKPSQGLPALESGGTIINGATQAGFSGDTNPDGPEIALDGSLIAPYCAGLTISSNNNIVHQIIINNFPGIAVVIQPNATSNKITGCFIGVDPTGRNKVGNLWDGIGIHGSNNQIGGDSKVERNIISGNGRDGIQMGGNSNLIIGNFIGTDVTGTKSIGNSSCGIAIVGAYTRNNTITKNIISGNQWDGIQLWASDNNIIQGNIIGGNINGNPTLGNSEFGVRITPGDEISTGNQIGGKLSNEGNTITANNRGGILIGDADIPVNNTKIQNNKILHNENGGILVLFQSSSIMMSQNSIHSNNGLGIDLDWNGVTENDPGDDDSGTNNLINFPILTWAHAAPGKLIIKGAIDTPCPETVTIEFFANNVPTPGGDPSGHGEGATFLGTKKPNKHGDFTAALSPVTPGTLITATATDAQGNTSEFAANIEAVFP